VELIPDELRAAAQGWIEMARDERRQLVRRLRACGLSYGEIAAVVPVPKATLAGWCRGISLSADQSLAIQRRRGPRRGSPRDTQRKRRLEVEAICDEARSLAPVLLEDPFFVGGLSLYWAEGSKAKKELAMANTDVRLLNTFIAWVRRYIDPAASVVLTLHLHAGNDLRRAVDYWSSELLVESPEFTKPYIKPDGTGHRKNHLPYGVCRVRVRRSTDAWHRSMTWIDEFAEESRSRGLATLPLGR
jgi:hypothetical protein